VAGFLRGARHFSFLVDCPVHHHLHHFVDAFFVLTIVVVAIIGVLFFLFEHRLRVRSRCEVVHH